MQPEDIIMLPDAKFQTLKEYDEPTTQPLIILRGNLFKVKGEDNKLKCIKENNIIETEVIKGLENDTGKFWKSDNIIYVYGQIYVPKIEGLREDILKENHNLSEAGHPGTYHMLQLLQRTWWWPGMKKDVKRYVTGCITCQKNKSI